MLARRLSLRAPFLFGLVLLVLSIAWTPTLRAQGVPLTMSKSFVPSTVVVGGTATTLLEAAQCVRPGGTIVVIGCFTQPPAPDWRRLMRHEVNLIFAWSYACWNGIPEFKIAIDLLASGKVQADPIVTHRFPLEQIDAAFQAAMRKGESKATKVLVTPNR